MTCKVVQANLNHSGAAQDLLLHHIAQEDCGLGILSEPYNLREGPKTAVSLDGLAVVVWRDTKNSPPMVTMIRGRGFVIVFWGPVVVASVYLSPKLSLQTCANRLGGIGRATKHLSPAPIIVAGDFNAWSGAWGSPRQDRRGDVVLDWAADFGLTIVNTGAQQTCVRA